MLYACSEESHSIHLSSLPGIIRPSASNPIDAQRFYALLLLHFNMFTTYSQPRKTSSSSSYQEHLGTSDACQYNVEVSWPYAKLISRRVPFSNHYFTCTSRQYIEQPQNFSSLAACPALHQGPVDSRINFIGLSHDSAVPTLLARCRDDAQDRAEVLSQHSICPSSTLSSTKNVFYHDPYRSGANHVFTRDESGTG